MSRESAHCPHSTRAYLILSGGGVFGRDQRLITRRGMISVVAVVSSIDAENGYHGEMPLPRRVVRLCQKAGHVQGHFFESHERKPSSFHMFQRTLGGTAETLSGRRPKR